MQQTAEEYKEFFTKYFQGIENLSEMDEPQIATTEKDVLYTDGTMKLYHYKPRVKKPCSVPVLITYALVNRSTMLDLQENRSLIRNLLDQGLDIYMIDWGYPNRTDQFLTMEDYIDGYMNDAVDHIRDAHNIPAINLLGVCQGGTFSVIYSALYKDKVKNLIATVTPVDFSSDDGLLFRWSKDMDVDAMVDYYGNIPGDVMNQSYLMLSPLSLSIQKYVDLVEIMDNKDKLTDFMRMERWIFDSPDQVGETFRKFIKEMYQENRLAEGTFTLGGRKVDMKSIKIPVYVVYAEYDTLVPTTSTKPLYDMIGSKDKDMLSYPVGHIGMYVSGKTQKTLAPNIAKWVKARS
ncbi:MAG: class III poly(R)-hydroxyalkanoic acid synthase subunit PhaC [Proteobacteria bacterium]|nr:class III poly(R)-hydroxyalkanoic acid synthase subunit PhaC [Pseudomonadota bacterium]